MQAQGSSPPPPWIEDLVHAIAKVIELAGVAVIVVGLIVSSAIFLRQVSARKPFEPAYHRYRAELGRGILIGLEFLVAADIIGTVAVEPTFENLGVLAVIVLIRTFLSFALETEIEGHWPWKHSERKGQAKWEKL